MVSTVSHPGRGVQKEAGLEDVARTESMQGRGVKGGATKRGLGVGPQAGGGGCPRGGGKAQTTGKGWGMGGAEMQVCET